MKPRDQRAEPQVKENDGLGTTFREQNRVLIRKFSVFRVKGPENTVPLSFRNVVDQ